MCDNSTEHVRFLKFKITSDKLETPVISEDLRVNFGVNLRLFRYGLISNDVSDGLAYEGDEAESLSPDKAPGVEDYKYCRKPLKDGYIYVYNENGKHKGIWYEYQIMYGNLHMIVWDGDKDVRQPGPNDPVIDCLKVHPESCVSIAYSPFQWPARYTRELLGDEQRRRQRMNRIDVKEWFRCFSLPDVDNIDNASVVLTHSGDEQDLVNASKVSRDIRIDKKAHDKNWSLYVTLHSPLDCANDICNDIKIQKNRLQQLVTPSDKYADQESDYFWLQAHAATFYQLLYGNESNDEKLNDFRKAAVSDEFLRKLLSVEERRTVRNKINKIRKSLLQFMDSDYYSIIMEELCHQTLDNRNRADEIVINQHLVLRVDPATIDRHMDVGTVSLQVNEDINDYLNRINEDDNHPVSMYMYQPIDLDDLNGLEEMELALINHTGLLSLATVAQRLDNISANAQSAVNTTKIESPDGVQKVTIPNKWFKKVRLYTTIKNKEKVDMWLVGREDVDEILSKLGRTREEAFIGGLRTKGKRGKVGIPLSESEGKIVDGCIILNAKIDPKKSALSKINPKLEKLFFSQPFLLLSGAIACFNLVGTLEGKKDTRWELSSVVFNSLVVVSEIGWFSSKFTELYLEIAKAKKIGEILGDITLISAIIASLVDAIKAFRRNDMDVCAASIGVAASFSMALFWSKGYGLKLASKVAIKTGIRTTTFARINAIISIISAAILIYLISVYWQDTPLLAYFKNCILSCRAEKQLWNWKSLTSETIFDKLLERKDEIIISEFEPWRKLKYSYEELLLLTTSSEVLPEYDVRTKPYLGYNIETHIITNITIKNYFSRIYFNTHLDFHFIVFYRLSLEGDIQSFTYRPEVSYANLDLAYEAINNCIQIKLRHVYQYLNEDIPHACQMKCYLCQRLVYDDGTTFPYDDKYIIAKVRTKKSYTTSLLTSTVKSLEDAADYGEFCNREDKTILSMKELKDLIIKNGLI